MVLAKLHQLVPLLAACPMNSHRHGRVKGHVVTLETGHEVVLTEMLHANGTLPLWLPTDPVPNVAIRLPAPYVKLLVNGTWSSFVLPAYSTGGTEGTRLYVMWPRLGLRPEELPVRPPRYLATEQATLDSDSAPQSLTRALSIEAAYQLRRYAGQLDLTEDFSHDVCVSHCNCVYDLESHADGLAPHTFLKASRECFHRAPQEKASYNIGAIISASMCSNLLRDCQI